MDNLTLSENLNLASILALIGALQPIVTGGVVAVKHVIGAIKGVVPDAEIDDDLKSLIVEALEAKADADRAASGNDPR
jgi:hypothetical protein